LGGLKYLLDWEGVFDYNDYCDKGSLSYALAPEAFLTNFLK
jgi:hypothetical protein